MIIDIDVASALSDVWDTRIHRQIDFKLRPKSDSVRSLTVRLAKLDGANTAKLYECTMHARLRDGADVETVARGLPNVCIADAASRLAREISRSVQSKHPAGVLA